MIDKVSEFSTKLNEVIEKAKKEGYKISEEEIKKTFASLDNNSYNQVLGYILASNIEILDYEKIPDVKKIKDEYVSIAKSQLENLDTTHENKLNSKKSRKSFSETLKFYLEELDDILPLTDEEENILLDKILTGDKDSKESYIERKLHYVVKKAMDFELEDYYIKELIEEGNIALLVAFSEFDGTESEALKNFINEKIELAMTDFINESIEIENRLEIMAAKVNFVSDTAKKLKEEGYFEPTIEELASYTKLSIEEIRDIIELAGDELISKEL